MRASAVVKFDLEDCNARRVQLDAEIDKLRQQLAKENAKASALETEFQQSFAAEENAKLNGA